MSKQDQLLFFRKRISDLIIELSKLGDTPYYPNGKGSLISITENTLELNNDILTSILMESE